MGTGAIAISKVLHLADEVFMLHPVSHRKKEQTVAGQPIASSTASFLIVPFNALGKIHVHHQSHVWLINPHPKRNGGRNHRNLIANKPFLHAAAFSGGKSGVICRSFDPICLKICRNLFRAFARKAVDDHSLIRPLANLREQLVKRVLFWSDTVGKIGTIEARLKHPAAAELEMTHDVCPHARIGRRGQRHHRNAGEVLAQ